MDVKSAIASAVIKTNHLSHSAIAIARILDVAPEAFAKALFDKEANDEYLGKVASACIAEQIAFEKAKEEETV